jgi:hypothetical protein
MAKLTDFKIARWGASANLYAQVVLFIFLFAGVTFLAGQYFQRMDLTKQHRYSLSPETRAYLSQLQRPVKAYVTISADSEDSDLSSLFNDVRSMLREYEYATRSSPGGSIEVEFVNVFQQRGKARLLAERYGISQSDLILLVSGEKQRIVFPNDLYVTEGRRRKQFQGEKVLTAAVLDVSSDQQKKLYFIGGHGEMRLDDVDPVRGLSQVADALRQRNFHLQALDLSRVSRVPEDADMLLLLSPQAPLLPMEEEILRQYMATEAGRLLVMIDPGRRHGLDELFFEWGVLVDDVVVLDSGPDFLATGGDILLRRFGDHAITRTLIDNQIPVIAGFCRSIRPDPGRPLADSLQVQPLIGTSETSWGERSYVQGGTMRFNEDLDIPGPLSVATVSERMVSSNLPINIPGGRLIVFGTSDFISNNRVSALGNLTLFLNTINWATDRDNLVNIPPRPIDTMQLVLSREETNKLRLSMLVFFPGIAALCGVVVYWIRRK